MLQATDLVWPEPALLRSTRRYTQRRARDRKKSTIIPFDSWYFVSLLGGQVYPLQKGL